jgi:hypothetical protein
MVSRYYIERLGGKGRVERIILMGGPHRGAVKALTGLLNAPELLPFGIMGERLRQVGMSFPASYQILPTYPLAVDASGITARHDQPQPAVSQGRQSHALPR